MANGFYIDPSSVKQGKMKEFYDTIAKLGGEVDKIDSQTEKEAYKAALTAALTGAATDEAKAELGFNQDDVNAIFGLEKSEAQVTEAAQTAETVSSQTVTKPSADVKTVTLSEKDRKDGEKKVEDYVKQMVKEPSLFKKEDIINALKSKFANIDGQGYYIMDDNGNLEVDAKYMAAINQVAQVLDAVDIYSITTEDEVKHYKKNAKTKLPNANKFQKDIIDKFEKLAEANAITRRVDEIADKFNEYLATSHNYTDAFEKAKKDAKKEDKDYTSQAVKIVEKEVARKAAAENQKQILYTKVEEIDEKLKNENLKPEEKAELLNKRELVVKIREQEPKRGIRRVMLDAVDKNDKIARKAIKKDIKSDRKHEAIQHTVDHRALEAVSYEEARGYLSDKILQKLARNKTIKTVDSEGKEVVKPGFMNPDGTYNFARISEVVGDRIHLILSRNDDDRREEELDGLVADFKFYTNEEFTRGEVRDIVRATGRKIEHKDLLKDTPLAIIPAAVGTISGLVAGHTALHGGINITQVVELKMQQSMANDVIKQLQKQGIKFEQTALTNNKIYIKILQQYIEGDPHKLNMFCGLINGLAIGTAIGILANLAFGGHKNEKTCVSPSDYDFTNPKYTDPKLYKRYVETRYANNPVKVAAMKAMVDRYVKAHGDEWHKYYQNDLRRFAGVGSTMNPDECKNFYSGKKVEDKVCPNNECKTEYFKEDGKADEKYDFEPLKNNFAHWDDGARGYECLDAYNKSIYTGRKNRQGKKVFVNLSNRMIKVIQAIDPKAAKSQADIQNLYKMSTIAAFAKDTIEHGVAYAIEHHPELPIIEQDLRNALGGFPVKGKTFTPDLYDDNGSVCHWVAPSTKAHIGKGSAKGANISDKSAHYFQKGTEDRYWGQDCHNNRVSATKEDYDRQEANRKKAK